MGVLASFSHKVAIDVQKYVDCKSISLYEISLILIRMSKNPVLLQKVLRLVYAARKARIISMSANCTGYSIEVFIIIGDLTNTDPKHTQKTSNSKVVGRTDAREWSSD